MNKELQQFLKESTLPEEDKLTIKFLIESIEKNKINEFISKTFLFHGDPGIGKTYFVEHLVKQLNLPIIFIGPFKFNHRKSIRCKDLKDLSKRLVTAKEAVVFIDDLQNTMKMEYNSFGELKAIDSERKLFLNLLEHIKRSDEKKFLFITINDEDVLEESWLDRIETKIELDVPKEKSKKLFLSNKYSSLLKKSLVKEAAEKSMGYNFRNLDELIKIAYREGDGAVTKNSLKKAFLVYSPSSMERFDVIQKTKLRFRDVIGNNHLKKELSFLKQYVKHPKLFQKSGIERSNVLVFCGPPGTGKTYMAKALAGELGLPMINVDAITLHGTDSMMGVSSVVSLARRFRNCIIFVDEFDKMVGREILSEDGAVLGSFEAELDGIRERTKAVIILTMNNKARFGSAFHDRIPCFNFGYPSEEERREFILNKVKKSEMPFSEEQIESMAKETEKKSYRQIERIWSNILFMVMQNSKAKIKNNKLIADKQVLEESTKEVLGFVSSTRAIPNMVG